jgi:hypothetical protein
MWQKEDEDVQWTKKPSNSEKQKSGPHYDYEANLFMAQNFINKVTSSLVEGMTISICGSQWLDRSLVMVTFNAGRYVPYGNWANAIDLHQSKQTFAKSLEMVFNDYVRKAQKFESRKDLHA